MNEHSTSLISAQGRRDQRHITVLIIGRVRGARGEYACVVNDISRQGLNARFPHPPRIGERLVFSLRGTRELSATVRWTDGLRGGVEFDVPIELDGILASYSSARVPRSPRFACNRPASLILDGRGCATDVLDVSLGGAKLALDPFACNVVGHGGTLILPTLEEPRAGIVRWDNGDRIGFKFAIPLTLDALTEVLTHARS